jgi:hypothetical protein
MSECSICGEYDDCLHPVDFKYSEDMPKEVLTILRPYLGIGDYLDDLDAAEGEEDFWENCAHICHKCFNKYFKWIVWWG